jgi:hypothetical protein
MERAAVTFVGGGTNNEERVPEPLIVLSERQLAMILRQLQKVYFYNPYSYTGVRSSLVG